uniref:Ig-like domain-containing protein n=1 Tax=Periophthalmus magnuspinnatus TaxID=409849 RepID=A0A3B4A2H1_9GOBI
PLSSAPVLLSSAPVPLSSPPEEINVSPITLPTIAPVQQLFKPVEAERQEVLAPVQLQDLDASEGQLVVLECRVKGTPSPRVEWYQDSKLIQDSPEFRILQKSKQSDICTLVIAEVFPEDSGTFKCTASNNYGSVSSTAELKIKGNAGLGLFVCFISLVLKRAGYSACSFGCVLQGASLTSSVSFYGESFLIRCLTGRDPAQLQLLHNQVLLEQQQDSDPPAQTETSAQPHQPVQVQIQSDVQAQENPIWSPRLQREPHPPPFHPYVSTVIPPPQTQPPAPPFITTTITSTAYVNTAPAPRQPPVSAPLLTSTMTAPTVNTTFSAPVITSPLLPSFSSAPPIPQFKSPELAAEFSSSATSSPTIPPFSPPPRIFPTRVLQSPTSPPSLVSSPTLGSMLLNTVFGLRAQSPPQAASPTSSSSTPSPIQNPVAFLSSVLPSLSPLKATNEMGLPKRAPIGPIKKTAKARVPSLEEIRESKECLLIDIEKKLRLKDDTPQYQHQQPSFEGKTASRPLGPINAATVINYEEVPVLIHCYIIFQEYKISNFEQRLMSEIEFRLERTPVEESDDEVQHEDVPTGKCIAPIFDKKLKNFRAMEGVPVTFSCKLVGVPVPKVYWFKDGKQILRKNTHYRKIREGDGTCALHIESVTSDDDGNYTVMAANPQGRISCSGHLIVQTGSARNRQTPISAQRVRSRIQEVETEQTQERFFRPHFLQAPGDMMAHEGKLCRLDCKVSGLPNPELMWLVNGRPIYPDLYHKMLVRENGVHSLVIDPLTQKDAGTYTCIASNKAGQSSFNLELSVVEKEMKHPPQFVEKLQNMGIPEGTPVRLECRVVGMPSPVIFWKKDNETIPRTRDRISMHQDVTGYVCLLIQPTTKEDAGWYTVSAKNEAGIVSCTCRLDIYAQWHQSVPAPMKKTQRTGSRYAALTGQGLDIKSAFCAPDTSPYLFASSPPEATLESDEL